MSTAYVLCVAILGQIASAEDVVSQMQAQDDQIQTLEFLFHLQEVRGPGYFEDKRKVLKTDTRGRLRFRTPHEVKLERLNEVGEVLESRAISSDGAQMKGFTVQPKTGSVDGFIATTGGGEFYLSSFYGVTWLFRHNQLDGLRLMLQVKDKPWQVSSVANLLRLTRPSRGVQWDIDPARGYWVVAGRNTVGAVFRSESTEPVEFAPGIWIAKRAENEQVRNGKVFLKVTATVDLDSVRINQPLDAKAFEIVFPNGTRIDNLTNNTSEFVGGQNSRDRKSVEQLAATNNSPAPVAPSKEELVPGASALRVPETLLWNTGYFAIIVSSLLLLGGGWFSWQRWWQS